MSQNTRFMAQCSYFIAQIILLRLKLSNPAYKLFLVCLTGLNKKIEDIELIFRKRNQIAKKALIRFSVF